MNWWRLGLSAALALSILVQAHSVVDGALPETVFGVMFQTLIIYKLVEP